MMSGEDRSLTGRLYRAAAGAGEGFYRFAVERRNRRFDAGHGVHRAHCPVISVGNLTTGGTGKTPMVIDLVERLRATGRRPAIVMRGYMAGAPGESDEAAVYAERLPDVPVVVNPGRVAAAARIQRDLPGPGPGADVDTIVLDDGFQHRRLAREVDLVLIDASQPWGYGHVLPRGMLREPPENLRRATGVIVTHADRLDAQQRDKLAARITDYHGAAPLAWTQHVWQRIVDADGVTLQPDRSTRVLALCGIGNPRKFFDEAARRFDAIDTLALGDHEAYGEATLARIREHVQRARPDALLTTEKDWVKLRQVVDRLAVEAPIWRTVLGIAYLSGAGAIDHLLGQDLSKP